MHKIFLHRIFLQTHDLDPRQTLKLCCYTQDYAVKLCKLTTVVREVKRAQSERLKLLTQLL